MDSMILLTVYSRIEVTALFWRSTLIWAKWKTCRRSGSTLSSMRKNTRSAKNRYENKVSYNFLILIRFISPEITRLFAWLAYYHHKFGIRHITLVSLLVGYVFLGGLMFEKLESPRELEAHIQSLCSFHVLFSGSERNDRFDARHYRRRNNWYHKHHFEYKRNRKGQQTYKTDKSKQNDKSPYERLWVTEVLQDNARSGRQISRKCVAQGGKFRHASHVVLLICYFLFDDTVLYNWIW